jgi:hypothetical protein
MGVLISHFVCTILWNLIVLVAVVVMLSFLLLKVLIPKTKQHPKCMDHAILHGKPFGIPLSKTKSEFTFSLPIRPILHAY